MSCVFNQELSPKDWREELLVIVDMVNHKIAQALPDNVSVETTEQGRDGPRVRNTVTHPHCFAGTQFRRLTLKTSQPMKNQHDRGASHQVLVDPGPLLLK